MVVALLNRAVLARGFAITYEKQDEALMMGLRNGVHKYEVNAQAGCTIGRFGPESRISTANSGIERRAVNDPKFRKMR